MTDVAGISVGAAFVGAVAGALTVSDLVRALRGGSHYSIVALDLRDPGSLLAVPHDEPSAVPNLRFTYAR